MKSVALKFIDFSTNDAQESNYDMPPLDLRSVKSVAYVVRWQLAKRRAGTAKTKIMSEISGTTAKPWKQKGTGRARQGSRRSVQFVGGRTCHGPTPRSFDFTMPKKIIKIALADALRAKISDNKLLCFKYESENIKTSTINSVLKKQGLNKVLFVIDQLNNSIEKSVRNIKNVKSIKSDSLNVYDIINFDHIIVENDLVKTKIINIIK